MSDLSAATALRLPVRGDGVQLGRPVDVLLEPGTWRAVGFVVHCGDRARRFLPYGAGRPGAGELTVASARLLLDDVGFYLHRSDSFRGLVGAEVGRGRRSAGVLRDVVLGPGGVATALEVDDAGERRRLDPDGATVLAARAPAA